MIEIETFKGYEAGLRNQLDIKELKETHSILRVFPFFIV